MSDETIRIMCPKLTCRRMLSVPESSRGRVVRCRNCGTNIRVPERADNKQQSANTNSTNENDANTENKPNKVA